MLKLGLTLSGGGARGAYEAGVVRALAEENVKLHAISGASIGALNGALVAASPTLSEAADRLEHLWKELGEIGLLRKMINVNRIVAIGARLILPPALLYLYRLLVQDDDLFAEFDNNGLLTNKPLRDILLPPVYSLEMEPISLLLKKLQQAKTHVAVVVDEYGGTCGIVTMEDILEELVGEIWDEHDEEETPITKVPDGTYLVDAEMSFDDFAEYFGLKSDSDMASVSGWVMEQFGRLPESGASFDFETLHVTITRIANHHIEQIRVTVRTGSGAELSEKSGSVSM